MNTLLRALLIGLMATTLTVACTQKTEEAVAEESMLEVAEPVAEAVEVATEEAAAETVDAAEEVLPQP